MLLEKINIPADLRQLPVEQLEDLCTELRQFVIDQCAQNPGHLGSSLGVIELTVALHYVFDTPEDRIVWDVGHQAYAHKILTGRRERFHTNRQFHGLSGFPSIKESEYDAFSTGHSSTSISAALGLSVASHLKQEERNVVAVIGDGAMTGGLAFEGLNNVTISPNNLLVVLNDNNMAIDPIKGGVSEFLNGIHTSKTYNHVRHQVYQAMHKMHLIDEGGRKKLIRFNNSLKSLRTNEGNNVFEGLNIRYFGPVDGHDVVNLVHVLTELKHHNGPKVLHILTKKGKGYAPAEKEVTTWHAPGQFDPTTGERLKKKEENQPPLFQTVFGETLLELAQKNDKIVGITPAMPSGCSMNIMMREMPDRVFDVGIAEGHAVTFSAGLAKEGLVPFCNIYSSFMQRAYDNVIHDVALQQLPVIMCLDRAGLVGSDGATHQGAFDLAYFRCVPYLTVAAPMNEHELRDMMYTAQTGNHGPFVIRYPRGKGVLVDWRNEMHEMAIGKGVKLKDGASAAVVSIGTLGNHAAKAIAKIEEESRGDITIAQYNMRFLKPLDEELLQEVCQRHRLIFTVEDGTKLGGLGSAVAEYVCEHFPGIKVVRLGLPDNFVEHGTQAELFQMLGLDAESMAHTFVEQIKQQNS
ncbi:MAG: 1-deoxy-D-xylulose-5-phosphate synthase [Paludibacteraceae bacterium]|nr:1-deoxy-D-xylulose-5-phosphate synthase [Paludibacteraceae bacterium]